jgi:hypothetical protein
MRPAKLPARLFAVYNWLDLAGEIPTLQSLSGDDLLAYCLDAASNAHAHGETDVTESDVFALRVHLGAAFPDGAKAPRLNAGERADAVKASVAKLDADAATSNPDGREGVQP